MPRIGDSMIRAFLKICKYSGADEADRLALEEVPCDIASVVCSVCGAPASMKKHGYYRRSFVYMNSGSVEEGSIKIRRLRCSSCKATHAVLPLAVIPYCVYSVVFIAALVKDWTQMAFSSIEVLCEHYGITTNTFYRLKARFFRGAVLVLGLASTDSDRQALAARIAKGAVFVLDGILSGFFSDNNISFCQSRSP
jgi:hypothetical protein